MSGVRGRSGRPAVDVATHLRRGTFRPARHRAALALAAVQPEELEPLERRPRIRAPKHLKPETRAWFRSVVKTWRMESPHLRLLQRACEAWDRGETARELIDREGPLVKSARGGARLNPAIKVEDMSRRAFAHLLRQLDLEEGPGGHR